MVKYVVEKFCWVYIFFGINFKDYDFDVLIIIEDIYKGLLNSSVILKLNFIYYLGFEGNNNVSFSVDFDDELDVELKFKFKEV